MKLTLLIILSTMLLSNTINDSSPIKLENGLREYIRDHTYQARPNQDEEESRKILLKRLTRSTLQEACIKTNKQILSTKKDKGIVKIKILSQKWTREKTSFWSEPTKTLYMKVAISIRQKDKKKHTYKFVNYKRVIDKLKQSENEHQEVFKENISTVQKINIHKNKEQALEAIKTIKQAYNKLVNLKKATNTRPEKPTNFLARHTDTNSINISWSPSIDKEGGLKGYYISYKDHIHYTKSIFTTQTNITLNNLKPNTGYTIRIRAKDDENTYSQYMKSWIFQPAKEPMNDEGTKSGELIRNFKGHKFWIITVASTPDGKHILSGGGNNSIKLWDINTGKLIRTFKGHRLWVNSVTTTTDGKYVLSGSSDRTMRLWDIKTGKLVRMFEGHRSYIMSVTTTADGKYALSGSWDKTMKLWNISTGELIRTFTGHKEFILSVATTHNGKYAVSGAEDKTIKIWDISTGKLLRTLEGHTHYVHSVTTTPDSKYVVSGSEDNTIKLWSISTGKLIRTFTGHKKTIYSVKTTPDGKYILSGSFDRTLKIWDISTGKLIKTLKGHKRAITSTAITPNGKYALSGSWDNIIKLWNITQ